MGSKKFTYDELKCSIDKVNGVIFTDPYLMNIVVYRDLNNPDMWNDTIVYFYHDNSGSPIIHQVDEFTANPGVSNMRNPVNKNGTAVIVEGWYRKLWKLGFHKGEYEALVQNTPIKVYRDSDRDEVLDINKNTIEEGMFGINLHRANMNSIAEKVGVFSAGCCVFRRYSDWVKFLDIVHLCRDKGGQEYWSLALLDKIEC